MNRKKISKLAVCVLGALDTLKLALGASHEEMITANAAAMALLARDDERELFANTYNQVAREMKKPQRLDA